jgi:hypothetical protein
MNKLMDEIESTKNYVSKMILFNTVKTGDPIIDTFLTTIILSLFTWFVNWIYDSHISHIFNNFSTDDIKNWLFKKNTVIIEGRKTNSISVYSMSSTVSSTYSDRFKAMWNYIINNIDNNSTIYRIKENHTNFQSSSADSDRRKNMDLFMVEQSRHFLIDKDIYAKAKIEQETDKDDKEKLSTKTDKITLHIYSYKYTMSELIKYIDNITEKYLLSIKDNRENKRFIYSLDKVELKEDESRFDCWREDLFESSRSFHNIFFDGKQELIDKIDFFLNNRQWYYDKGIPYSLGIGLYGPPGTGKTSFIKALANYTNRHIIVISLKLIKTKTQLENLFFETTYNDDNEDHSINWNKKILVFEDIDCIGDIVLNREEKEQLKKNKRITRNSRKTMKQSDESVKVGDIIESIREMNSTETASVSHLLKEMNPITLDDILNLWDGIRETPGRILIISSNHYNKLDPALIRPGRIDITRELCNASHSVISEIYFHLFGNKIDKNKLIKVKEYFYSPADLINIYISNKDENSFLERLLQHKKA